MDYFKLKTTETSQLQRNFCPSLNYLEEFAVKVFPRMRIISRDKFDLSGPSGWLGKHPATKHRLLFSLSCEWSSSHWKPQVPFHSQLRLAYIPHFTFLSWTWGSCMDKVNFEFLLLICLMWIWLDQPKEPLKDREKFLLSNTNISISIFF